MLKVPLPGALLPVIGSRGRPLLETETCARSDCFTSLCPGNRIPDDL